MEFGKTKHANGRAMTATGQTGRDAYLYEAQQVANAQRELDARMARLVNVIQEECAEGELLCPHRIGRRVLPMDLVRILDHFYDAGQAQEMADFLVATEDHPHDWKDEQ